MVKKMKMMNMSHKQILICLLAIILGYHLIQNICYPKIYEGQAVKDDCKAESCVHCTHKCTCDEGWAGPNCDTDSEKWYSLHAAAEQRAQTFVDPPDQAGPGCGAPVTPLTSKDPCFKKECDGGGGICNDSPRVGGWKFKRNFGGCKCVCKPGYSGLTCKLGDPCLNIDCGEHGTCKAGECVCRKHWSGQNCESPDDITAQYNINHPQDDSGD
jgi:hypothetical protein